MKSFFGLSVVLCVGLSCSAFVSAFGAEGEDWNLPAPQRVAEGETSAARGDLAASERILKQLESEAKAAGSLAERTTAEARVDRLRLAVARAHVKAGAWDKALALLKLIELEGKSPAIQRAICAATLDALKPLLLDATGQCVAPWTPAINDKFGPQQPQEALRAPYTKVDRKDAAEVIRAEFAAWERLEAESGSTLTDSEKSTVAALSPSTRALVRYAWGLTSFDDAAKIVDALPAAERRAQSLRLSQLLLREHDLGRALPRLIELERSAKDDVANAAVEELLRISTAYEKLRPSLPMWNPGVEATLKPYLADPAWAARRDKIVQELDAAIGKIDLKVVLADGEYAREGLVSLHDSAPTDPNTLSSEVSDIVVPPDILAKAELGDHFETVTPDAHLFHNNPREAPVETPEEKAARMKLDSEKQKREGEKPSRYRKLGFLAGVLRKNVLLDLDPKVAGVRELRDEFELQVDHQEFMIEALGPDFQKDTSQGFRPLTPGSPLRLVMLSRYHGDIEIEARQLPSREAFEKLDAGITPDAVSPLPVVKTYTVPYATLGDNLDPLPSKRIFEIKNHGLASGFYVLTARARYSPVVAVTRVAVSETKVVVRYAPKEILIWTLDRITGMPHASKLKGEIKPQFNGQVAWAGAPLPRRDKFSALDAARFYEGIGDELNGTAVQNADESYVAGVAEGKKLHDQFPSTAVTLPADSDAHGLARVQLPPLWRGHKCWIHAVADGCDVDAIHELKDVVDEKIERVADWVADRPIVRPGQTVKLHGFVRENHNGRMVVARDGSIPLKVLLNGVALYDAAVRVDDSGACDVEQIIDADATDGALLINSLSNKPICAVIGGETATRRVRLELPAHPVAAGSHVKARAIVESAAGMPLSGIAVKIEARFYFYQWDASAPLPFGEQFAKSASAIKGNPIAAWNMDREMVSNANGEVEFQIDVPEDSQSLGTIQVIAPGGHRAQASASAHVMGLSGACVWHADPLAEPPAGKPARIAITARTFEGTPYTKPFQVSDNVGRSLARFTPDQNGDGRAEAQVTAQNGVRIRPAAEGDGGWMNVAFGATGELAEVRGDRGVLAARMDRKEYRIGDTAHVYLRADRPGLKVLLTTESAGVTRAQIVDIAARTATFDLTIGEQDAPNATVAVTALADDKVECVLLPLDVAPSERKLAVQLSADTLKAEPGQTVKLTARVNDSRGQPVAGADLAAIAFDRQLLTLGDDPAPEFGIPFLAAGRVTHDVGWTTGFNMFSYGSAFLWLTPEWSFGPYGVDAGSGLGVASGFGQSTFGSRSGGGRRLMVKRHGGSRATEGLAPFRVRARFSEQALWVMLKTGADGTVTFPFTVPDNLTTFRAVAYALDARGFPGTASLDLSVQRDIEVSLDLPPELRDGDRSEVGLSVWNYGDAVKSVTLKPAFPLDVVASQWNSADGPKPIPASLDIPPHSSVMLTYVLDVKAPAVPVVLDRDATQLRFEVSASGTDGKALDHAVFQAPLRIMGRPEHETTQAVIRDNATVRVPFPGSYDPLRTNLTLTLRRGLRGLALDIRELQYVFPEHCPEQTLSRFVPAMVLATTLPADQQTPEDHAKLERVLKSGIARMRTLEGNGLSQDLQPLTAWYLRRLSEVPAGYEALRSNADWERAAENSQRVLAAFSGKAEVDDVAPLNKDAKFTPSGYGAFRQELWLAFGAAQNAYAGGSAKRREVRAHFAAFCQSCLDAARGRRLAAHDRALAGLLCAELGLHDCAEELLRLRVKDFESASPSGKPAPKEQWLNHQSRTLAMALDVMTSVELKQPEREIFELALRLQGQASSNGAGFGTTFINGVGLLALADAMNATGSIKSAAGPIVVKLGGKVVSELPAGADLRRVVLDRTAVEAAFNNGWEFSVEAAPGQVAGMAVDRATLAPEKIGVKSAEDVARAIDEFVSPSNRGADEAVRVSRCLFVRAPGNATALPNQNWRPYSGQPLPLGTELLVLTKILREPGTEFVQVELPALAGWEAMVWNEEFQGTTLDYLHPTPGMLSAADATALFGHDVVDGKDAAAQILKAVRDRRWGEVRGSLSFDKQMEPLVLSDRGSHLVFVLPETGSAEQDWNTRVIAQSGVLRAAGKSQLPGVRAWCWYNPAADVTSAADLIQVTAGVDGTLDAPGLPLPTQPWLEKSWELLARDGWNTRPAVLAEEQNLHALALLALGRSESPEAPALIEAWVAQRPAAKTFQEFQLAREHRMKVIELANPESLNATARAVLLARYASWDGVRADWAGQGLGAQVPPTLYELSAWLDQEKARAKQLLPLLPPDARAKAVALQSLSVRDALQLWFGDDQKAASNWLWNQPQHDFVPANAAPVSLDEWTVTLKHTYGLNITVDAHAPLVLALPTASDAETLKQYVQNHLASAELVATGIDDGQNVILTHIASAPDAKPTPLDAKSALALRLFAFSVYKRQTASLREALALRGIQLVAQDVEFSYSDSGTIREAIYALAKNLNKSVRVERDIIELK